jgi:AraC-like DNA-binding protein
MLYLTAVILAFFLSSIMAIKKQKSTADIILLLWLLVTGLHLLIYYKVFTGSKLEYPTLLALAFPLPLVQGPFLYLYTRHQTKQSLFKSKELLHFLPILLSYALFFRFYFIPFDQKVEIFRQNGKGYELQQALNLYAIYLSGIIYTILSLRRLLLYRKTMVQQFSNTEKINFNWLLYLIIWIMVIWVVVLFVQKDDMIFGAAALFVIWLGYFGINQVQIFNQKSPIVPENIVSGSIGTDRLVETETNENPLSAVEDVKTKYQKSNLTETDAADIHNRLSRLMEQQKPYTDPDLTLNQLAKMLDVHPNHLSQVINSKEGKSFYDMINEKRIEEFIRLISEPEHQQYTLVSIAYDCGFNSKASFNRNFKKHTGLTPSDYVKSLTRQIA